MSYNNEPTIESIRETVLKAIAVNKINSDDKVSAEIDRLLTNADIALRNYAISLNGKSNAAGSRILEIEKKVKQQFSNMTDTIMELVKIKEG